MNADVWAGTLVIGKGLAVFNGPSATASRHRHDAVQIMACASRPAKVGFDDQDVEGNVVIVPSRVPHRVEQTGGWVLVALVEPSAFGDQALQPRTHDTETWGANRLAALVGSASADTNAATILSRGAELTELAGGRAQASAPGERRPEVVRSIQLIETSGNAMPRLDEIARAVALSPSRLSRVFAEEVGFPFRRYVLWTRLRTAAFAVRAGADMTSASAAAGFSDSAHFSRVFRSTFGLTRSEVLPILQIADMTD